MNILACSTHALLIDIPLFAGPVLMLAGALVVATVRDRRRQGRPGLPAGSRAGA